jgi:hypothetical protein
VAVQINIAEERCHVVTVDKVFADYNIRVLW